MCSKSSCFYSSHRAILGVLALIFSIVGLATGDSKAPGIIGLIFACIDIVFGLCLSIVSAAAIGRASA